MIIFRNTLLCFLSLFNFSFADELVESSKLLKETCGYTLSEELKSNIIQRKLEGSNGVHSETIDLKISLDSSSALGSLKFSCLISDRYPVDHQDSNRKTASEEIELEDSGGRYARVISWDSDFIGHGWQGTVAYTNAILGDDTLIPTEDFFYICPCTIDLSCFSLEIKSKDKIAKNDRDKIISLLSSISYSPKGHL